MPNALIVLLMLLSLPLLLPLLTQIAAPHTYVGKLTRAPIFIDISRGVSLQRAAARLGSAHVRNFRGCTISINEYQVYATVGKSRLHMRQ